MLISRPTILGGRPCPRLKVPATVAPSPLPSKATAATPTRCYCSICRKTVGSSGSAINLGGDDATLKVTGEENISIYHTTIDGRKSPAQRRFCKHYGTHLWVFDPRWPDLVHPFAGVVD